MVEERSDPPTRPTKAQRPDPSDSTDPDDGALRDEESLESGLAGDSDSRSPALLWGFFAAVAGLIWWWAFRRWRHPATWLGGVVPFLGVLFVFYMYLERTLPAGY